MKLKKIKKIKINENNESKNENKKFLKIIIKLQKNFFNSIENSNNFIEINLKNKKDLINFIF